MFAFDPGCVKTHTSARCRKYNSKTHGFHSGLQYDLACLLASHRKLFYALSGRWSFHTTKTQSGHSASINMLSRVTADALRPVFEVPEVSVSVTARRRFPLHAPRTRILELQ